MLEDPYSHTSSLTPTPRTLSALSLLSQNSLSLSPQVAFADGPHSDGWPKTMLDSMDVIVEWTFIVDIFVQFATPVQPILVRFLPLP